MPGNFNPIVCAQEQLNRAPGADLSDAILVDTWDNRPLDQAPGTYIAITDEGGRVYRLLVNTVISTGLLAAGSKEYILADVYQYAIEWYQQLLGDGVPGVTGEVWEGTTAFGGGVGTITTDGEWLTLSAPTASGGTDDYAALFSPPIVGTPPVGMVAPALNDGLYLQCSLQVTGVPSVIEQFSIVADADNGQHNFRTSYSLTVNGDPQLASASKVGVAVPFNHVSSPQRMITVHAPDLFGASYVYAGNQVKPVAMAEEATMGAPSPSRYFGFQANPLLGDGTAFRVKDIWCARLSSIPVRPL